MNGRQWVPFKRLEQPSHAPNDWAWQPHKDHSGVARPVTGRGSKGVVSQVEEAEVQRGWTMCPTSQS